LRISAAKIAVIGYLAQNREPFERASLRLGAVPQESVFFFISIRFFSVEAFHFFAVTTEHRGIHTGVEIVFLDPDGGFFRVNEMEMKEGADHLTEMTAATF